MWPSVAFASPINLFIHRNEIEMNFIQKDLLECNLILDRGQPIDNNA